MVSACTMPPRPAPFRAIADGGAAALHRVGLGLCLTPAVSRIGEASRRPAGPGHLPERGPHGRARDARPAPGATVAPPATDVAPPWSRRAAHHTACAIRQRPARRGVPVNDAKELAGVRPGPSCRPKAGLAYAWSDRSWASVGVGASSLASPREQQAGRDRNRDPAGRSPDEWRPGFPPAAGRLIRSGGPAPGGARPPGGRGRGRRRGPPWPPSRTRARRSRARSRSPTRRTW